MVLDFIGDTAVKMSIILKYEIIGFYGRGGKPIIILCTNFNSASLPINHLISLFFKNKFKRRPYN